MKVSVVTSPPIVEPLDLEEVKLNLKVSGNDEDTRISALITSARVWAEGKTNRSLIKQTRIQYMDEFWQPSKLARAYPPCVELLYGPLLDVAGTTVISVKYYDEDDTLQTLNPDDYWVDSKSAIPRIYVKESWPTTKVRPNAVEIEYYAGYGVSGASVPANFKDAMHLYVAHFFENRVPEVTGTVIARFELGINRLLDLGTAYQNAY